MPALATTTTVPENSSAKVFLQIKSDIATYYGLDKDPEKLDWIGRQFHDVLDDLNRKKLWQFNLIASDTTTTVAGQGTYAMPADLWRLYSIRKTDNVDYLISNVRQRVFDLLFSSQNNIQGYPYVSSNFNIYRDGTVKLFPTPDSNYQIVFRYFRLISKPGDAEYLDMPEPFHSVPKYGTLARVATLVGEDPRYWEAKFQEAFMDMNNSDEDLGDEDLRFVNIEEFAARIGTFLNPSARPRYLDWY